MDPKRVTIDIDPLWIVYLNGVKGIIFAATASACSEQSTEAIDHAIRQDLIAALFLLIISLRIVVLIISRIEVITRDYFKDGSDWLRLHYALEEELNLAIVEIAAQPTVAQSSCAVKIFLDFGAIEGVLLIIFED